MKYAVMYKNNIHSRGRMLLDMGRIPGIYDTAISAIQKCWELSDEILNAHLNEDTNEDDFYRESSADGDSITVYYYGDTFTYWVISVVG